MTVLGIIGGIVALLTGILALVNRFIPTKEEQAKSDVGKINDQGQKFLKDGDTTDLGDVG